MFSPSLRVYVCKNRIAATKDVKTLQMIDTSGSLLLGNLSLSLLYIYIIYIFTQCPFLPWHPSKTIGTIVNQSCRKKNLGKLHMHQLESRSSY